MQKTSSASIGQLLPAPSGPSTLPKFITEDHAKLTFQAYFKEAVRESADECWRVRKLTITYFLVDDTVQIYEIGPDNSGIWGGPFLSRRKLPKANDITGRDMYWTDFIVGNEFECFSRTFRIYGCDDKTRKYMEKRGIPLPPNTPDEEITDDFSVQRKKSAEYLEVLKRSESDLHAENATKRAVYKFVELFEHNSSSLTSTFRKLDNDHSGEFEFEEFKSALAELQMAPNDVDLIARHYFKAANAPDSGKPSSISINDFMKQLSNDSVLLIGQHRKQ